jgi:MFS family permease
LPFAPRLLSPGNYYIYDNPSALKPYLQNAFKGDLTEAKFSLLYSVYSFPNIVLPFFGGFLVDKYGAYNCTILFSFLVLLGQVVVALGASATNYNLMLLGRVLYGMGGETITVSQGAIIADWFAGGELAFAIAANLAITRSASSFNNILSVYFARTAGLAFAFWFGTILCGLAVALAFLVRVIDARAVIILQKGMTAGGAEDDEWKAAANATMDRLDEEEQDGEILSMDTTEGDQEAMHDADVIAPKESTLQRLMALPNIFWLVVLSCVAVYGVVVPFNNTAR